AAVAGWYRFTGQPIAILSRPAAGQGLVDWLDDLPQWLEESGRHAWARLCDARSGVSPAAPNAASNLCRSSSRLDRFWLGRPAVRGGPAFRMEAAAAAHRFSPPSAKVHRQAPERGDQGASPHGGVCLRRCDRTVVVAGQASRLGERGRSMAMAPM